jgi:hypothetical protein
MAFLTRCLVSFVAIVLLAAAAGKLGEPRRFASIIRNYRIVPDAAASWLARLLPAIEGLLGALLLLSIAPTPAGLASAAIFLVFGGAIAVNLLRGRRDIACGCFGSHEYAPLSWTHVLRNLALMAAALSGVPALRSDAAALQLSGSDRAAGTLAAVVVLACWWLGGVTVKALRRTAIEMAESGPR